MDWRSASVDNRCAPIFDILTIWAMPPFLARAKSDLPSYFTPWCAVSFVQKRSNFSSQKYPESKILARNPERICEAPANPGLTAAGLHRDVQFRVVDS
jgi:hypothetical protein